MCARCCLLCLSLLFINIFLAICLLGPGCPVDDAVLPPIAKNDTMSFSFHESFAHAARPVRTETSWRTTAAKMKRRTPRRRGRDIFESVSHAGKLSISTGTFEIADRQYLDCSISEQWNGNLVVSSWLASRRPLEFCEHLLRLTIYDVSLRNEKSLFGLLHWCGTIVWYHWKMCRRYRTPIQLAIRLEPIVVWRSSIVGLISF